MIKLIVTDMDGCFLNSAKQMPVDAIEVIKECTRKGYKFVVASGRSYSCLNGLFAQVKDEIAIICDNGAFVLDNGHSFSSSSIDKDKYKFFINLGREDTEIYTIACGQECAYIENLDLVPTEYLEEIHHYYPVLENVDDLTQVEDDILKICYLDPRGSENNVYKRIKKYDGNPRVVLSAQLWTDILNLEVNKGHALFKIQEKYNIKPEETVVFGDYLNDLELMKQAKYAYAPIGAHEEIKNIAYEVIGSNDDWSIINKIKEIINYK